MTAFATVDNLATLLNRTFTSGEREWLESLLDSSAEFMRGHMGVVYPAVTATFTTWPSDGWVTLPAYLRSIESVTQEGQPVAFERIDNSIHLHTARAVTITMTAGLAKAPDDLVGMNCALVSQAMLAVEMQLGLTVGGLSSVALDDFKVAFADGGEASGMFALTPHSIAYLQNRYGTSAYTTEANR